MISRDSPKSRRDSGYQPATKWLEQPSNNVTSRSDDEKLRFSSPAIAVKDNVAYCTCNGEVLEEALKLPPTGPIGLEADRGQVEYRRIRIKELP